MADENGWQVYYALKGKLRREAVWFRVALGGVGLGCFLLAYLVMTGESGVGLVAGETGEVVVVESAVVAQRPALEDRGSLFSSVSSALPFGFEAREASGAVDEVMSGEVESLPRYPAVAGGGGWHGRGPSLLSFVTAAGEQNFADLQVALRGAAAEVRGVARQWEVAVWSQPAWLPGETCGDEGVVLVGGHVSWYGRDGPFATLGTIEMGSEVGCVAGGETFVYVVESAFVVPYSDTVVYRRPLAGATSTLVLFSCTPEVDGIVVVKARIEGRLG